MVNPETGGPLTSHTTGPVDLIHVHGKAEKGALNAGSLCDISPTLLDIMAVEQPAEMTGNSLISK